MATKELQAIIAAYASARAAGRPVALVTVVQTSGSTYRRPGARMLVLEDGKLAGIGLISGGCLEDDARDRALETMAAGKPALIRYDTTADGDILFGTGVGCQGVVHVLIEPLPAGEKGGADGNALDHISAAFAQRMTFALATVVSVGEAVQDAAAPIVGDYLFLPDGTRMASVTSLPDSELTRAITRDTRLALARMRPCFHTYPGAEGRSAGVFIDIISPPRALLICGAGEDAVPLMRLARELGWRVRVVDPRSAYARRERFPQADEVIVCPSGAFAGRIPIEAGEAAVVMTHNFNHDLAILRALLGSAAGYIGVLGPARRTERLLSGVAAGANGESASLLGKKSLQRVYGPAGLDIGAEAPEQIALSIIAEIEAVKARRKGGALKRRRGPLHAIPPVQ